MGKKGTDEFRGFGMRAPEETEKDNAAAPLVVSQTQQRSEKAVDDLRCFQGFAAGRLLHPVENPQALLVEPVEATPEHLLHQRLLGAEVIIHRRQVNRRLAGNLAHRRSLVAMLHEQLLGGIENALTGINVDGLLASGSPEKEVMIHTFV